MSSKVHLKKEDRRFMKPKSISTFLKCSICYEIYYEPLRLFCGHTFCDECIKSCIKASPNCPVCRTAINIKQSGLDLFAQNIINEQEVYCIYQDCSWNGELVFLQLHLEHECLYCDTAGNRAQEKEFQLVQGQDDDLEEMINVNTNKGSLISRALMKNDSLKTGNKFDLIRKMVTDDKEIKKEESHLDKTQGKKVKKVKTVEIVMNSQRKKQLQEQDNIDFLMELYE